MSNVKFQIKLRGVALENNPSVKELKFGARKTMAQTKLWYRISLREAAKVLGFSSKISERLEQMRLFSKTTGFQTTLVFIGNLILTIGLLVFILAPSASAQTPTQKGITVYPSIHHLDLVTDIPEYDLTYINSTNYDVTLLLSAQDFNELEESYKINFLEGKDASNYKYSLSSWISFENKNIQLSPGEEKSVRIFIDKDRITKGGHYASILAEIEQPNQKKQVLVKAILSSLLFVRASTGQEIEKGRILSLRPQRDWLGYPRGFTWRFENSGNVHVIPYGLIQVYDPFGKLVSKGILNEDSLDALPESIRTYQTKITTYQKILPPGEYVAKISTHFGKQNLKSDYSIKFFSWGHIDFVKVVLLLIIIAAVSFYFRKSVLSKLKTKSASKL